MPTAAIGQLCSTTSIISNLRTCETLVEKAAAAGAKAIFLPEASDYIASNAAESALLAQSSEARQFIAGLQQSAVANKIEISVGVHEVAEDREKIKNTLLWIDRRGMIAHRYQKLHLYDVNIEGGPIIKESEGTEKGPYLSPVFHSDLGALGMLICFDMRFPEASLALRRQGAQIILYPSAFAIATGQVHWKPLLQARAIETQAYVIAAAQSGSHNAKRSSYGHSMIVDPWGRVLIELGAESEPQIACVDIDLTRLEEVRRSMPLVRRHDAYSETVALHRMN